MNVPAPEPVDPDVWCGKTVRPGERETVRLTVSETYSGADIKIPIVVWRGKKPGPTVAVIGAIHGDEINGTGAIRRLITAPPFTLDAGTLLLVPLVNIFGFERFTRYLPDRRDLNRCFPGSSRGSLASRLARAFFDAVIRRSNFAIDLHSAAIRRTNFPNVRADMSVPELAAMARAFGAELIVSSKGPGGSLRAASAAVGCHTLILEAGEVWKVEPSVMAYAIRGVGNCLSHLGMISAPARPPAYQVVSDATMWVRANKGGFLTYHVAPGDHVDARQPIATNTDLTGKPLTVMRAPREGVILGMTTHPSVAPGDPVVHIAFSRSGVLPALRQTVEDLPDDHLHERARGDLAANVDVREPRPGG